MNPRKLDLNNETFDFSETSVDELEYMLTLECISSKENVIGIEHSLPLNNIFVHVKKQDVSKFPKFNMDINRVFSNKYKDQKVITYVLRSTRYLSGNSGEVFYANYSDRHMAYVKLQLDLFDSIQESVLIRSTKGQLKLMCSTDSLEGTEKFRDLMSYIGLTISDVGFDSDKNIDSITFKFDQTRQYSKEIEDLIIRGKTKKIQRKPIKSEKINKKCCGCSLRNRKCVISMAEDQDPDKYSEKVIGEDIYYKIDVDSTDNIIMSVSECDNDNFKFTNCKIMNAYMCRECDTLYRPKNTESLTTNTEVSRDSVEIPDTGEVYVYKYINIPYM
jgi:hypothetical protein